MKTTRRSALRLLTASAAFPVGAAAGEESRRRERAFPIGACDWSLKKKQDIGAFEVAKEIGLEGLQVSFSQPGSDFDLRDKGVRERYFEQVEQTGIRLASLGMGVLNQMPLASHPESISWVGDAIDVMARMKEEAPEHATDICLLAFFGKGDINGKPELMEAVINKLKGVAPKAEEHGVILGIESYLSADDHLKIIEGVGSEAIQVYYDTANSNRMGYDIYREVVQLGGARICQIHCKENGALLGAGKIDFDKFKTRLDEIGYRDWLIIEGAMPKGADLVESYRKNFSVLDRTFR